MSTAVGNWTGAGLEKESEESGFCREAVELRVSSGVEADPVDRGGRLLAGTRAQKRIRPHVITSSQTHADGLPWGPGNLIRQDLSCLSTDTGSERICIPRDVS